MAEFVRVVTGGPHRDMGVDMGRAVSGHLEAMRDESSRYHRRLTGRSFEALTAFAMKRFLTVVERRFPGHLAEVRGIAEGAKLPFADVFFLTVDEELSALWRRMATEHCSSAAIRRAGSWLVAHNEDYPPRYSGRLTIVDAKPDDGPAFLALTYPYILGGPSCGMNAAGMAFTANSLRFPARGSGVPTNYLLRDLYASRSLDDAERRLAVPDALMANSCIIVSANEDSARDLELSPHGMVLLHPDATGSLIHTNHMVGGSAAHRAGERPTRSSKRRYAAMAASVPTIRSRAGLGRLFSSAADGLRVAPTGPGESCTIATVVMDVSRRTMYVAKRGPDGHGFKSYRMRR